MIKRIVFILMIPTLVFAGISTSYGQTKRYTITKSYRLDRTLKHKTYGIKVNGSGKWDKIQVHMETSANIKRPSCVGGGKGPVTIFEAFVTENTGDVFGHIGNDGKYIHKFWYSTHRCRNGKTDSKDFRVYNAGYASTYAHLGSVWEHKRWFVDITLTLEGDVRLEDISAIRLPGLKEDLAGVEFRKPQPDFIRGVDLSSVTNMKEEALRWFIGNESVDPAKIMAEYGANMARFKLFVDPIYTSGPQKNQPYNFAKLTKVKQDILNARANGLKVLLDFHLSDSWADPGKQVVPGVWRDDVDDPKILAGKIYEEVQRILAELGEAARPDIVQIGNETNTNMLLPRDESVYRSRPNNLNFKSELSDVFGFRVTDVIATLNKVHWDRQAQFFNAGLKAVRDHSPDILTAVHLAGPYTAQFWADQAFDAKAKDRSGKAVVDYELVDIIAASYYPGVKDQDIPILTVREILEEINHKWDKYTLIMETAFPFTYSYSDNTTNLFGQDNRGLYPEHPDAHNQRIWLEQLRTLLKTTKGNVGFLYWEPFWVGSNTAEMKDHYGSAWENMTFFDFEEGEPLNNNALNLNGGIMAFCDQCSAREMRHLKSGHYFETGLDGWTTGGSDATRVLTTAYSTEGKHSLRIRDNSGNSSAIISPDIGTRFLDGLNLSFKIHAIGFEAGEHILVEYYDGTSWKIAKKFTVNQSFRNNKPTTLEVSINDATARFKPRTKFRIRCNASDDSDRAYIDAVNISTILYGEGSASRSLARSESETSSDLEDDVFTVYPNPVDDSFITIYSNLSTDSDIHITLLNLSGQILNEQKQYSLNKDSHTLRYDLPQLSAGTYILRIKVDGGPEYDSKVIVN